MKRNLQLLIVNSKDRAVGTPTNFQYCFSATQPQDVKGFRVNKVTVPFSWYTVIGQTFQISYNGTPHTATIAGGQYTVNQLVTVLQDATDAAVGAGLLVWSYESGIDVFNLAIVSGVNTFSLNFGVSDIPSTLLYKSIGLVVGFVTAQNVSTSIGPLASYTSPYAPNLTGMPNIYVKSQTLQTYENPFFNKLLSTVICVVPVNVNVSNYIVFENPLSTVFANDTNKSLGMIDFQLVDEYDTPVDLRGLDWTVEIECYRDF